MDGFAIKPVEHAVLRAEIHRARAACLGTPLPTSSGLADQALPITAPQGPGQPPAPANARLLDAADGRRRWGDDAAWAQALVQFCRHKRDWLRHDQPHDAEALLALGHRFKGVAANLAMPSLAQAADELERCARAGQPADLAWRALRETVTATLAAVQAELDTLDALNTDQPGGVAGARDTTAAPVAPAPAPTGALSDAQWGPGLQALAQALRQGEHPEAAWRHLAPHGPARFGADAWARLSQAVDDFDFDAAAQAVDNLLDTVQPAPAGQPPIAAGAWS
jgi:HPt (histidine-containing phosphotransfer) domain-containing protein